MNKKQILCTIAQEREMNKKLLKSKFFVNDAHIAIAHAFNETLDFLTCVLTDVFVNEENFDKKSSLQRLRHAVYTFDTICSNFVEKTAQTKELQDASFTIYSLFDSEYMRNLITE